MSDDKKILNVEELEEVAGGAIGGRRKKEPLFKPPGAVAPQKRPLSIDGGAIQDQIDEILENKETVGERIKRK